jgi:hypothetical protein
MTSTVAVTAQIPADVWAAFQQAAQRELTAPESIARQILCEACEEIVRERMRKLAEYEKAARAIA